MLNKHETLTYNADSKEAGWDSPSRVQKLVESRVVPGSKVLDIGIGTGLAVDGYAGKGATVIGLDHDQAMLDEARAVVGDEGSLRRADINSQLPIQDLEGTVDVVQAVGVLEFARDLPDVFDQVHGSLKDGGVFAFTSELIDDAKVTEPVTRYDSVGLTVYRHTPDDIANILEQSGFDLVSAENYDGYERDGQTVPYGIFLAQKREKSPPVFELTQPESKVYTTGESYSFLVHVPIHDFDQRVAEIGSDRSGVLMTSLLNETRQGTFCGEGGLILESPARSAVKGMSSVDTGGEIADGRMDDLGLLQQPADSTQYNQIDIQFNSTSILGVMIKVTPDGQELGNSRRNIRLRAFAEARGLPIALVEVTPADMPVETIQTRRDLDNGNSLTTYDIPGGSDYFLRVDIAHGNFYHSPGANIVSRSMMIDKYGQVTQQLSTEQEQQIRQELSRLQEQGGVSDEEVQAVISGFL